MASSISSVRSARPLPFGTFSVWPQPDNRKYSAPNPDRAIKPRAKDAPRYGLRESSRDDRPVYDYGPNAKDWDDRTPYIAPNRKYRGKREPRPKYAETVKSPIRPIGSYARRDSIQPVKIDPDTVVYPKDCHNPVDCVRNGLANYTIGTAYRMAWKAYQKARDTGTLRRKYDNAEPEYIIGDMIARWFRRARFNRPNRIRRFSFARAIQDADKARNRGRGYWQTYYTGVDSEGFARKASREEYRRSYGSDRSRLPDPKETGLIEEHKVIVRHLSDVAPESDGSLLADISDATRLLERVWDTLDETDRTIIHLTIRGYNTLRLGKVTGIPQQTVHYRLSKIRERLARMMQAA